MSSSAKKVIFSSVEKHAFWLAFALRALASWFPTELSMLSYYLADTHKSKFVVTQPKLFITVTIQLITKLVGYIWYKASDNKANINIATTKIILGVLLFMRLFHVYFVQMYYSTTGRANYRRLQR